MWSSSVFSKVLFFFAQFESVQHKCIRTPKFLIRGNLLQTKNSLNTNKLFMISSADSNYARLVSIGNESDMYCSNSVLFDPLVSFCLNAKIFIMMINSRWFHKIRYFRCLWVFLTTSLITASIGCLRAYILHGVQRHFLNSFFLIRCL